MQVREVLLFGFLKILKILLLYQFKRKKYKSFSFSFSLCNGSSQNIIFYENDISFLF